jgi:hypothetical protein
VAGKIAAAQAQIAELVTFCAELQTMSVELTRVRSRS